MSATKTPTQTICDDAELEIARIRNFEFLTDSLSRVGVTLRTPTRENRASGAIAEAIMWLEGGWPEEALKVLKAVKP